LDLELQLPTSKEIKAVNIKPMLARLQGAMGLDDLIEQMVLLPPASSPSDWAESTKSVNLVVGYNSSPVVKWLWT